MAAHVEDPGSEAIDYFVQRPATQRRECYRGFTSQMGLGSAMRPAWRLAAHQRRMRLLGQFAAQRFPLSSDNRQRLCHMLAWDSLPVSEQTQIAVSPAQCVTVRTDFADYVSRLWFYGGYAGGYEFGTTRLMRLLARDATCIFDIGANVGYYTLLAGAMLAGRGTVHAFEPHPGSFERLVHNVRLNEFSHVHLNQAAVTDADGPVRLLLAASPDNATIVSEVAASSPNVEVEGIRFDTYCRRKGIAQPDLIKVDAEGAELLVLRGMGDFLLRCRPDLVLEVLPEYAESLDAFFRGTPYRVFLVEHRQLRERDQVVAVEGFRDYYFSVDPRGHEPGVVATGSGLA